MAWAATHSWVRASGPRTAQAGQQVRLHFTGYAARGANRLRVFLDDQSCATTARSEGTRMDLRAPTDFRVHARFRDRLIVSHSSPGTHVVCAYLVSRSTDQTAARTSWRYVTS
jgi:hypothetical protein